MKADGEKENKGKKAEGQMKISERVERHDMSRTAVCGFQTACSVCVCEGVHACVSVSVVSCRDGDPGRSQTRTTTTVTGGNRWVRHGV